MATMLDDFEDGDVAEWNSNTGKWIADTQTYGGTSPYQGTYCGVADSPDFVEVAATLTPPELDGGFQPTQFIYYWEETNTSNGGGLRLSNSNGNYEVGMATDNPQWYYSGGDGIGQFYGGDGYERWIEVILEFDWSNGNYTLDVTDLSSGGNATHSGSLRQGTDIETVEIVNFSGGSWESGSNFRMGYDAIQIQEPAPTAPSNTSWTTQNGDDADVTWDDNSSNEDGFHIDRYHDGSWSRVADVGANTTSWNETNLLDGEEYRYRVRAYNSSGPSSWDYSEHHTTSLPAPSNGTLTIDTPTSGTAEWTDNSDNENEFRVQVEEDGSWSEDSTPGADTESATVTFAESADQLRVRVRAETEHTESGWTYSSTYSTNVSGLSVDATRDSEIDLLWNDVDQEDEVRVYRAESSGSTTSDYSDVGGVTDGLNTFTDTGLENGEKYYYRVVAVYGGEKGTLSGETNGVTTLPAATWNTIDTGTEDELSLDWSKEDDSPDGDWEVLRSTDGSSGSVVATVSDLSRSSYTDTGLKDGEKYYYTVRRNTDHASADSAQNNAITVLPAPTSLTVDAVTGDQADLSWTPNHNYGDQRVEVKPTDTSTWQDDSGALSLSTTSYTTTNLLDGEKYDLRVLAVTEHTTTEDQ